MAISPFNVFRHPHPVQVYGADTLTRGVLSHPDPVDADPVMCSVQSLGRDTAQLLASQGKRISDFRTVITDAWLPETTEAYLGAVAEMPEVDSLITPEGLIMQFFGKQTFTAPDLIPGQDTPKSLPARIKIEGWWFAVDTRLSMRNILPYYSYNVYRLPADEQL